jgi:pimeloyl-ACP methyl ester carboxylesterase
MLGDGSILVNELGSKSLIRASGEHGKDRTAVIGGLEGPVGMAAAGKDSVYVTEAYAGLVSKIETNGEKTVVAKDLKMPEGIALAPDGMLVVAEVGAKRIVQINPKDGAITEIAANAYWFLPTRWLLLDKYESSRHAPAIKVPTTVIVAEHDVEIPRSSTDKLMTRFAPGIAKLVEIPGADHNSIMNRPGYRTALQSGL